MALRNIVWCCIAAAVCLAGGGCATGIEPSTTQRDATTIRELDRLSAAERSRRFLLGAEIGLEVREWIIEADSRTIAEAMSTYRAKSDSADVDFAIDDELEERLRSNGLRAVLVRKADLPALEAAMGHATMNRRGWYGQLTDWTPLHGQRAGGPQQAIFVDGRPRRFNRGEYRLMTRAWLLPMEDGQQLNLQLVPEYLPPQRDSLRHLLAQPLQDGALRGEAITSITLDMLIPAGFALVLTGEEPGIDWWGSLPSESGKPNEIESTEASDSSGHGNGVAVFGPHADLPPTLGEMLFEFGGVRGGRGMLIFLPRVAEERSMLTPASR